MFQTGSWSRKSYGKGEPAVGWYRCHQIWDNTKRSKQSTLESLWDQKKDLRSCWVLWEAEDVWAAPQHITVSSYSILLFKINNLTSDDGDLYRCVAVNDYGEAACSAGLRIIQGRPYQFCAPRVLWSQVVGFDGYPEHGGWVPRALSKYPWCKGMFFPSQRTGGHLWVPPLWWLHESMSFKARRGKQCWSHWAGP